VALSDLIGILRVLKKIRLLGKNLPFLNWASQKKTAKYACIFILSDYGSVSFRRRRCHRTSPLMRVAGFFSDIVNVN